MIKRKLLVLLLAFTLCFVFSSYAFAADGYYFEDEGIEIFVNNVKLDKTYSYPGNFEFYDDYLVTTFNAPAKGKVTMYLQSDTCDHLNNSSYFIFCTDLLEEDSMIADIEPTVKYNSKLKKYTFSKTVSVPKGKCFLIIYDEEYKDFSFKLSYRPSFGATSITKIASKKKGFTVKYKKASAATGYQIRYSRSSKMTNAKTVSTAKLSRTVSKLKAKKKYFVQVRSYKKVKVNGKLKTYYSSWSKKKAIKTK